MAGKLKYFQRRGDAYWTRIIIPKHLKPFFENKHQLQVPLSSNRKVAERAHHAAVVDLQGRLAEAQRQYESATPAPSQRRARPLSIGELAHAHFAEELQTDETLRHTRHSDGSALMNGSDELFRPAYIAALRRVVASQTTDEETASTIGWAIDNFRNRGSTHVEHGTPEWRKLAVVLAGVQIDTIERVRERESIGVEGAPRHPILIEAPAPEPAPRVTLTELYDGYIRELKASGKGAEAERRWKPVIADLKVFLKHEDATRITAHDLIGWKDKRLKDLKAKTVKDVYLAAVRAILSWATDNKRIESNPAVGVKVRAGKRTLNREKGFDDNEARAVLKAARDYQPKPSKNPRTRESEKLTMAKRWAPWLCAYTGARIAEITQLRKCDVMERDGIPFLRITPEAGSVKSEIMRDVPLHPHLVELGFLTFVASCPDGPLFYTPGRSGARTHPSKTTAGRVGAWIRSMSIVSPEVQPNHGWRHRFKTVGREVGLHAIYIDAIQGHAPRTEGEKYGDVPLKVKLRELEKYPRYEV